MNTNIPGSSRRQDFTPTPAWSRSTPRTRIVPEGPEIAPSKSDLMRAWVRVLARGAVSPAEIHSTSFCNPEIFGAGGFRQVLVGIVDLMIEPHRRRGQVLLVCGYLVQTADSNGDS